MPDSGHLFNEAVESTAVIGSMRSDILSLKEDVGEIRVDAKAIREDSKAIRHTIDRAAGAMIVIGSLVSVAVSVAIAILK